MCGQISVLYCIHQRDRRTLDAHAAAYSTQTQTLHMTCDRGGSREPARIISAAALSSHKHTACACRHLPSEQREDRQQVISHSPRALGCICSSSSAADKEDALSFQARQLGKLTTTRRDCSCWWHIVKARVRLHRYVSYAIRDDDRGLRVAVGHDACCIRDGHGELTISVRSRSRRGFGHGRRVRTPGALVASAADASDGRGRRK